MATTATFYQDLYQNATTYLSGSTFPSDLYAGVDLAKLNTFELTWVWWYKQFSNPVVATGIMSFLMHEVRRPLPSLSVPSPHPIATHPLFLLFGGGGGTSHRDPPKGNQRADPAMTAARLLWKKSAVDHHRPDQILRPVQDPAEQDADGATTMEVHDRSPQVALLRRVAAGARIPSFSTHLQSDADPLLPPWKSLHRSTSSTPWPPPSA